MRKLIVWVFMYSLDGLLADEGTEYWRFCFGLPVDPAELEQKVGVYQSAYAHIMGRATYEGMGGVSLWRSLVWLDLIDEFRLDLHPYVAGEGTRLFDDVPKSYRLDLVSSTEFSNGTVGLQYRRHR
jgi:dihydrofolate reductase